MLSFGGVGRTRTSSTIRGKRRFISRYRAFHFDALAGTGVGTVSQRFRHGLRGRKGNEGESSRFLRVTIGGYHHVHDLTESVEVISQDRFVYDVRNTTHEDLGDGGRRSRPFSARGRNRLLHRCRFLKFDVCDTRRKE